MSTNNKSDVLAYSAYAEMVKMNEELVEALEAILDETSDTNCLSLCVAQQARDVLAKTKLH